MIGCHSGSLQNLMVEGNRKLAFVQICPERDEKVSAADYRLRSGGSAHRVEERGGRQSGFYKDESTLQTQILEWREVQHMEILGWHKPPFKPRIPRWA